MQKIVDVACAVMIREDGAVLLGSRPAGKPYAGYWEFPGGKLEAGEGVFEALVREIDEELGMTVKDAVPWFVTEHAYEHAHVRLHFWRVWSFSGDPQPREGQHFAWFQPGSTLPGKLLPKDAEIVSRVALPDVLGGVPNMRTLSVMALRAEVERRREDGFVGAQAETPDDVAKAAALDLDYVVGSPVLLSEVGGALTPLPFFVRGIAQADLLEWRRKGAHGAA